jgi:hypothetical protein
VQSDGFRVIRAAGRRDIFLNGIGTGLDLQYLPTSHRYTALDLTRAMLVSPHSTCETLTHKSE